MKVKIHTHNFRNNIIVYGHHFVNLIRHTMFNLTKSFRTVNVIIKSEQFDVIYHVLNKLLILIEFGENIFLRLVLRLSIMFFNLVKGITFIAGTILVPATFTLIGWLDREMKHDQYLKEVKTRAPLNRSGVPHISQQKDFTITSMVRI